MRPATPQLYTERSQYLGLWLCVPPFQVVYPFQAFTVPSNGIGPTSTSFKRLHRRCQLVHPDAIIRQTAITSTTVYKAAREPPLLELANTRDRPLSSASAQVGFFFSAGSLKRSRGITFIHP